MSRGKDGLRLKSLKYMLELTSRCNLRCGMCPMDVLTRPFEDACGVKVNATYMGSSDDLVAKLRAGGAETIDLISPSSEAIRMSRTTPTISKAVPPGRLPMFTCSGLPIGFSPVRYRRASASLLIATGVESLWSAGPKSRPATNRMPIVLKNRAVTGRTSVVGASPAAGAGRSAG